jgi:hypothetical protein
VRFFRGISGPEYRNGDVQCVGPTLDAGVGKLDAQCFGLTRYLFRTSECLDIVVALSSKVRQS